MTSHGYKQDTISKTKHGNKNLQNKLLLYAVLRAFSFKKIKILTRVTLSNKFH